MNAAQRADASGDPPARPNGSPRRRLWNVVGLVLVGVVFFVIGRQLYRDWPTVNAYSWRWNLPLVSVSVLAAFVAYVLLTRAWRSVLRGIQVRLRLSTAYWIFILSNLGRYVPGKLWQFGAAAWMGRGMGLKASDIAPSLVVYQLYLIPVGGALALSWGRLPPPFEETIYRALTWILVAAAAGAAIWPHRCLRLLRPLVRRLDIDPERWRIDVSRRVNIAVGCAAGWLCLAFAFGLFCLAVTPLGMDDLPLLMRAFIASYLMGYVALFAPGGLGVREGALALLLSPILGPGPAMALALVSRIWITVTELVAVGPALAWARRDRAFGPRRGQPESR